MPIVPNRNRLNLRRVLSLFEFLFAVFVVFGGDDRDRRCHQSFCDFGTFGERVSWHFQFVVVVVVHCCCVHYCCCCCSTVLVLMNDIVIMVKRGSGRVEYWCGWWYMS